LSGRARLTLAAVAIHAAAWYFFCSPIFFYAIVGTATRVFGGAVGERGVFDDVDIYYRYASRIVGGEVPYRGFAVEYPPLALPLFVLPRLAAGSPGPYRWAFGVEMLAVDAAIVWLVAGRSPIGGLGRVGWYSAFLVALGPLPISRFDLAPTLLAFGSALLIGEGRAGLGGMVAGLGALAKVFPGAVVAASIGRWRSVASLLSTAIVGAGAWLAVGGAGVGSALRYHAGRGLEIGTIYSGVLMVSAKLRGRPLASDFNHTSHELIAPGAASAASMAIGVQLAAILLVALRARRPGAHPLRLAGAAVIGFAVFGKVLSPQYVIWGLPFVAAVGGRRSRILALACCVATTMVYPWAGVGLSTFQPLAVAILNVRNALLLGLFASMVRKVGFAQLTN